ncbi:MAG: serine/threonine-protein phosphatase [Prevotella sp.]|nr:serine/threonine-protein phosphatase [Prevotella sp.]
MRYSFYKPYSIYEQGKRPNQEDSIFPRHQEATAQDRIFILCDGMGGYEYGELASSTICESLSSYLLDKPVFSEGIFMEALQDSFRELVEKSKGMGNRMGTTLAFLAFTGKGCMAAHIGDSRVYHIRPSEGKVLYVSHDHSLVNDLYDAGEITEAEMKTSPQRHIITRAIRGGEKGHLSQPEIKHITDIRPGDYFLLMSDGMLENLETDDLLRLLVRQDIDDTGKMDWLRNATAGNADNHSAMMVHVAGVEDTDQCSNASAILPSSGNKRQSKKVDWWKAYFMALCVFVVILWLIMKYLF